ncbi:MAG: hypothetical protein ABEJ86_03060 [Halococcoides sp.]
MGATAITQSRQQSADQQAIHEMQSLQTRIGEVATGQTRGSFDGATSQEMTVRPDRGWIRVTQHNYDGAGSTEVIANQSLGEVVYERKATTLAYQAGGLWRLESDGSSQMVAEPAIEYREATMTVPTIGVQAGRIDQSATIAFRKSAERQLFPNETGPTPGAEIGPPYNGTDDPYANPMYNGSLTLTVQSRFDDAWATYFRSKTGGTVRRVPGNNIVRVTMETPSRPVGDFDMPLEGGEIHLDGLQEDHPLDEFVLRLQPDGNYGNLHWGMYVDNGTEKFEIHFQSTNPGKCKHGNYEGDLYMTVFYQNATTHEEWHTKAIDPDHHSNFSINCSTGTLTLNALADEPLYYKNIENIPGTSSAGNKWIFGDEISDTYFTGPTTSFDVHEVDPGQYDRGDKERAGFVVNHYFGLLNDSANLTVTDGPGSSSRVDEAASEGRIYYPVPTGPQYLQYLHVTDRDVVVDVRQ